MDQISAAIDPIHAQLDGLRALCQEIDVNLMHCYESIIKIYTEMGNTEMADLFQARYEECRQENEMYP